MNNYLYAELKNNIVVGITSTHRPINNPNLVEIPEWDLFLIGKTYENGVFIDTPVPFSYNRYSFHEFLNAVTEDEWDIIEEISLTGTTAQKKKARKLIRYWMTAGIDFNDTYTYNAVTWLVNNTAEWTPSRAQELAGTPPP